MIDKMTYLQERLYILKHNEVKIGARHLKKKHNYINCKRYKNTLQKQCHIIIKHIALTTITQTLVTWG